MIQQKLAIALLMAVLALLAACGGGEQVLPTATPEAETKFVPDLEPQSQSLMLRLTSPDVNLVTDSDLVSVSGVASPDATVSVNGRLALPDAQGRFSINLGRPKSGKPMAGKPMAGNPMAGNPMAGNPMAGKWSPHPSPGSTNFRLVR